MSFGFLLPELAQNVTAIGQVAPVRGEDFQGNGAVIPNRLERPHMLASVEGAGA